MTRVIVVDLITIADLETRDATKRIVVEYVTKHPNTMIAVLNGIPNTAQLSKDVLRENTFPWDTIIDNPLNVGVPPIVFKTMFATKTQAQAPEDYETILVIDKDQEALDMWESAGVRFTFNPLSPKKVKKQ